MSESYLGVEVELLEGDFLLGEVVELQVDGVLEEFAEGTLKYVLEEALYWPEVYKKTAHISIIIILSVLILR